MLMESAVTAAALAASVGATAYTISSTKITAPFRGAVAACVKLRAPRPGAPATEPHGAWAWASQLLSCPYCLAHWLSFAAVAVYRPFLVDVWAPADFAVTSMAIVTASMAPVWLIKRALAPAAPANHARPAFARSTEGSTRS